MGGFVQRFYFVAGDCFCRLVKTLPCLPAQPYGCTEQNGSGFLSANPWYIAFTAAGMDSDMKYQRLSAEIVCLGPVDPEIKATWWGSELVNFPFIHLFWKV